MRAGHRILIDTPSEHEVLKDEVDTQRGYTIAKRHDLVQKARHQLTTKELKLIDFMVSKVQKSDKDFTEVHTTINEINEVMEFGHGTASNKETAKALLNLSNKGFWIRNKDDTGITIARWLQTADIADNGTAVLRLDDQLAPYLLQLTSDKNSNTMYELSTIVSLKSKYSVMLYQLLKSWSGNSGVNGSPDDFLEYFGQSKLPWWRFNTKYLQPAINELNTKSNMRVHLITKKKGRKVVEVELNFEPQIPEDLWNRKSHAELKKETATKRKAKTIQPPDEPDALSDEEIAKLQKQLADELARRDQKLKARKQRLTEQGITEAYPFEHKDHREAEAVATGVSGHQPEPLDAASITAGDEVRLIRAGDLSDLRHNMIHFEISDTLQTIAVYTNGNTRLKAMTGKHAGKTVFANASLLTLQFTEK